MKTFVVRSRRRRLSRGRRGTAYSLLEMIIVLAVISILVAALLPSFIRHLDRVAGEREEETLRKLAKGFRDGVMVRKVIPDASGWAAHVAGQLGMETGNVLTNARRHARVFLIDPAIHVGVTNASPRLPYVQTAVGSRIPGVNSIFNPPVSPRFLILSTISTPLPNTLASGVGATSGANAFTSLWATADGAVPAGWTFARGDDLKIQRIDCADLFVQLVLRNRDWTNPPSYSVDGSSRVTVPNGVLTNMYLIRGSDVRLFNNDLTMEYSELMQFSGTFEYYFATWLSPGVGKGITEPGPMDLERAMKLFMSADPNIYAQQGVTQAAVSNAMVNYMSNFIVWRDGSPRYDGQFQGGGTPPKPLSDSQTDLANKTSDLINPR